MSLSGAEDMATFSNHHWPAAWKLWLAGIVAGIAFLLLASGPGFKPWLRFFSSEPPRLSSLTFDFNGRPVKLLAGQSLLVKHMDRLKVIDFETSGGRGARLTLEGRGFEAEPLLTGAVVGELLPASDVTQRFDLLVKQGDKTLGQVGLIPIIKPIDWVLLAQPWEGARRLDYLKAAWRTAPANPLLLDQIIETALSLDRRQEAAAALKAKGRVVFSIADQVKLARLYEELDQPEDQAQVVSRLAELEPDQELWADKLVSLTEKSGNKALKDKVLKQLAGQEKWADKLMDLAETTKDEDLKVKALEQLAENRGGSRSAEASKKLAYTYAQAGRWKEAAQAYEEAARLDPKDINIQRNLAVIYGRLADEAKRRQALEKVLALDEKDLATARELARLAPPDKSREAWQRVLKLKPDDEEALIRLVRMAQARGDADELIGFYARLSELKPQDPVLHYNLGLNLMQLKRWDAAEVSLKRAHQLSPKDVDILTALWDVQRQANKLGPGLETAEKLLAFKPHDLELYRYLYSGLKDGGDLARLEDLLGQGVKANAKSVELWKMLVQVRLARRNPAGAAKALDKVVELEPKDADNRLRLAKLLESLGQLKEAMDQYAAVLELEPQNEAAGEAYLRLKFELLKGKKK